MKENLSTRPKFLIKRTDFFDSLKDLVEKFFKEKKIKKTGNAKLFIKAAILLTTLVGLYVFWVFFTPSSFILRLPLWLLFGLNLAAIGFNVMHDACHGSFSSSRGVNNVFSLTLNMLGGYASWWKQKHNIFHHTYVNLDGIDEDIAIPGMRVHPHQRWKRIHKYQHYYWWFMYGLTYFAWILISDFVRYFSNKVAKYKFTKISIADRFGFWFSKAIYGLLYVYIPIKVCGWEIWLEGFAIYGVVCGFVIAIIFQLAHNVEETDKPLIVDDNIDNAWAIHQVETTANFSTRSKPLRWLCGGLNFQIEHHLFPLISHVHYPDLQPLIKETCLRYELPYNEKPMPEAIKSHVAMLKRLGKKPEKSVA